MEVILPDDDAPLSIRVPMEDMNYILMQLWKGRKSEDKCNELYEKYKALIPELKLLKRLLLT